MTKVTVLNGETCITVALTVLAQGYQIFSQVKICKFRAKRRRKTFLFHVYSNEIPHVGFLL
jgi:hypothetical protein